MFLSMETIDGKQRLDSTVQLVVAVAILPRPELCITDCCCPALQAAEHRYASVLEIPAVLFRRRLDAATKAFHFRPDADGCMTTWSAATAEPRPCPRRAGRVNPANRL